MTELQLWVIDHDQKKWRVDKDGTDLEMVIDDQKIKIDGSLCFEKDVKTGKTLQRKRTRHVNGVRKKPRVEEPPDPLI